MVTVFVARGDRLLGEDVAARRARWLGQAICFFGGVLQGTTSISSPLIGSYFHALRLRPSQFVWVLAAMFELNSFVQLIGYSLQGLYNSDIVALGIVGLIPTLIAMILGIWTRGRLDPVFFRRIIVVLVVASTLNLLWRTFLS